MPSLKEVIDQWAVCANLDRWICIGFFGLPMERSRGELQL